MNRRNLVLAALSLLLSGLVLHGTAGASIFPKEKTPDEQRTEIRKTRDQALKDLYRVQPEAERHIRKAAGYAVFSNFGVKVLVSGCTSSPMTAWHWNSPPRAPGITRMPT